MTNIINGIFNDCLSAAGLPGGGTVSAAIQRVMRQRHDMLREVILGELREGNFERVHEDEHISVFIRLIRDAEEGVARNNLRLMARAINGMAENNALTAPAFQKYASILASLTEEEIKVLGVMARYHGERNDDQETRDEERHQALLELNENPHITLQALMRTGLVYLKGIGYGGGTAHSKCYELSSLMHEIMQYTDFIIEEEMSDA